MPGAGGGENGELFNGYRVSVLQDKESSRNQLHNSVNMCNSTEPYT